MKHAETKNVLMYTAITTHADGTQDIKMILADSAKEAHEIVTAENGDTVRVYANTTDEHGIMYGYGIYRGALSVAKRCAERTYSGTDTQNSILADLKATNAKAGLKTTDEYVHSLVSKMCADAQDYHAKAYEAIITSIARGESIDEQYHNAFLAINSHIMENRRIHNNETSLDFIMNENGDIVSLSVFVAHLINENDSVIPSESLKLTDAQSAELRGAIVNAYNTLSPTQKQITRYLVKGYSQSLIATKMRRTPENICEHVTKIRAHVLESIKTNAPQYMHVMSLAKIEAEIIETAKKRTADRHKNTDKRKQQNAEKMRRYRERKQTEKLMLQNRGHANTPDIHVTPKYVEEYRKRERAKKQAGNK